ncbi:hypothetical protein LSTR_LSTR017196 [Laodelphax striatellus]|uniref:Peptidase S1 domain-containing protein n=1 Tax=Laodelphax striatellus TaxID=195883 RepID=A0A482WZ02_LAOST|nr:hypothetical protein LSTR_LSTR017196 [Laodelphax striatellus]
MSLVLRKHFLQHENEVVMETLEGCLGFQAELYPVLDTGERCSGVTLEEGWILEKATCTHYAYNKPIESIIKRGYSI